MTFSWSTACCFQVVPSSLQHLTTGDPWLWSTLKRLRNFEAESLESLKRSPHKCNGNQNPLRRPCDHQALCLQPALGCSHPGQGALCRFAFSQQERGGLAACCMTSLHGYRVPFWVHSMLRHPYKKDPKRDPNLENYTHGYSCVHRFKLRGTSRTKQHGNGAALLFRALSTIVGGMTKLLHLDFDSTQPTARSNISK